VNGRQYSAQVAPTACAARARLPRATNNTRAPLSETNKKKHATSTDPTFCAHSATGPSLTRALQPAVCSRLVVLRDADQHAALFLFLSLQEKRKYIRKDRRKGGKNCLIFFLFVRSVRQWHMCDMRPKARNRAVKTIVIFNDARNALPISHRSTYISCLSELRSRSSHRARFVAACAQPKLCPRNLHSAHCRASI
jgi:hypothetical protein